MWEINSAINLVIDLLVVIGAGFVDGGGWRRGGRGGEREKEAVAFK